jgi:putative membrane protein insertion efficiency factor
MHSIEFLSRAALLCVLKVFGVTRCLVVAGWLVWVVALFVPHAGLFAAEAGAHSGPLERPAVSVVRFYQEHISDLRYGRCRFEPSCSQYALEVVEEQGLLVGSALAADRLVRCNAGAWRYYRKGPTGRLSDPPRGKPDVPRTPVIPEWVLPALPSAPPFPPTDSCPPDPLLDRIRSDVGFADALAQSGDCYRALTEYRRVAFLGGGRDLGFWSRVKGGECLYRMGEWRSAEIEFLAGLPLAADSSQRDALRLMVGASRFNDGDYSGCKDILHQCELPQPVEARCVAAGRSENASFGEAPPDRMELYQKWLLLKGFCSLAMADWREGTELFRAVPGAFPDSPYEKCAGYLARRAPRGEHLQSRSPALAAGMSVVLPGLGQIYCGRFMDGVRHLVVDGILIYQVYRLVDHDNYPGAYLMAGIALPFYTGNVIGAKRSAERFNQMERSEFMIHLMGGCE